MGSKPLLILGTVPQVPLSVRYRERRSHMHDGTKLQGVMFLAAVDRSYGTGGSSSTKVGALISRLAADSSNTWTAGRNDIKSLEEETRQRSITQHDELCSSDLLVHLITANPASHSLLSFCENM